MAKLEFLTPVGRLVQGDPFEAQTKNMQGQPLVTKSGEPTQRYFIAVAFRKDDPLFPALYQKLVESARSSFPTLFNAQGQCTHPRFSWKIADGDGVDDNGKSNANKEGFAGCWVMKFSSSFAPRCFHAGHYQPHEQIQDPKAIQRGYFVRVSGTIEGNADTMKPGLYVNLSMVELSGVGPIISSGPDASAVFGGTPAALPAGASPLPMNAPGFSLPGSVPAGAAPGLPINPGMTAAPAAMFPSSSAPAPVAVAPNPAFLAMPGAAPAPAPLAPPPAAPAPVAGPQMTAKAGAFTYEQYIAQGWNDAALHSEGLML